MDVSDSGWEAARANKHLAWHWAPRRAQLFVNTKGRSYPSSVGGEGLMWTALPTGRPTTCPGTSSWTGWIRGPWATMLAPRKRPKDSYQTFPLPLRSSLARAQGKLRARSWAKSARTKQPLSCLPQVGRLQLTSMFSKPVTLSPWTVALILTGKSSPRRCQFCWACHSLVSVCRIHL